MFDRDNKGTKKVEARTGIKIIGNELILYVTEAYRTVRGKMNDARTHIEVRSVNGKKAYVNVLQIESVMEL